MKTVKLFIIDDHPLFRQGLRDVLEMHANMEIVGEAGDGDIGFIKVQETLPDVVLIDINLPTINGLQLTRKIKSAFPKIQVITITGYDKEEQIFHALRAGVSAYCPKDLSPEKLVETVLAVYDGFFMIEGEKLNSEQVQIWVEDRLGKGVDLFGGSSRDNDALFIPLSPREMEILESVTRGLSNKEIAYHLSISHQTVKNHMTAILRKLQVEDRTQAAIYALSRGWVRLDDDAIQN